MMSVEPNEPGNEHSVTGWPAGRFRRDAYRLRNTVERAINKLRGYRAVATRFGKRDYVYRGTVDVASIGIWLRDPLHLIYEIRSRRPH